MRNKKEHADMMAQQFNNIMDAYNRGEVSPTETVITGLQMLKIYLESSHAMYKTPNFQINKMNKALEETRLGNERRTLDKRFMEGCLIEGLILFGAVPEQTYAFMLDYQNIARSAAIKSHKLFQNNFYLEKELKNKNFFIDECAGWLIELITKTSNQLPLDKRYHTAIKAFNNLMQTCKIVNDESKELTYFAQGIRPYENYHKFVNSFEILEEDKLR